MGSNSSTSHAAHGSSSIFVIDLARAYGGAILFSFPILMTMEMWWQGFAMHPSRLLIFTLVAIPLLLGLSYYDGFEDTFTGGDDLRETFIAYFVGFTAAAFMLYLFGVLQPGMSWTEKLGKVAVQAVTASLGAMFAQSLIGGETDEPNAEKRKRSASYAGQMFLTIVGSLFLSMSVAPTEEMLLIAYKMNHGHTLGLMAITLVIMHAFIVAVERRARRDDDAVSTTHLSLFARYTVVSYVAVLLVSYYVLWTFGSTGGHAFPEQLESVVVLAFPAGLGGAASRLIL